MTSDAARIIAAAIAVTLALLATIGAVALIAPQELPCR